MSANRWSGPASTMTRAVQPVDVRPPSDTAHAPVDWALVEEHVVLVRHIVLQVAVNFPRHVDRQELAGIGLLGLVDAARNFDPTMGVSFQRFASPRVRGAILDAVRRADWAPRSVRNGARQMEALTQQLATRLKRPPTRAELAEAMGVDPEQLAVLERRIYEALVLTLDEAVTGEDGEDITLGQALADREDGDPSLALEARELYTYLRDSVALLPERHRTVIVGHFFDGRSHEELANELGVTPSRISQLRAEALERIREGIEAQYVGTARVACGERRGRVARRKAGYAEAIANQHGVRERFAATTVAATRPAAQVLNRWV